MPLQLCEGGVHLRKDLVPLRKPLKRRDASLRACLPAAKPAPDGLVRHAAESVQHSRIDIAREYGVLLAGVVAVVAIAATALGGRIGDIFDAVLP